MRSSLVGRMLAVLLAACFGVINVAGVGACAMHGAHPPASASGHATAHHTAAPAHSADHADMHGSASTPVATASDEHTPQDCSTGPCTCPGMCNAPALIALDPAPVFEVGTVLALPVPIDDAPEVLAAFRRRLLPPATAPPALAIALQG